MATVNELKEYLSQFPDDMETDIDIIKLEPWRLELLEYMQKIGYLNNLEKLNFKLKKYDIF